MHQEFFFFKPQRSIGKPNFISMGSASYVQQKSKNPYCYAMPLNQKKSKCPSFLILHATLKISNNKVSFQIRNLKIHFPKEITMSHPSSL
jgi:hypothetical protein